MELFKDDRQAEKYYKFQEAREEFTEEDNNMTKAIKRQTLDPEKIPYDQAHVEIYSQVGLGESWRIEQSIEAGEIKTASAGFQKVTREFDSYRKMNKKVKF